MTEQTKPASPTRAHASPTPLEVARAVHRDSAGSGGRDAGGPDARSDQDAATGHDTGPAPAEAASAGPAGAAADAPPATPATPAAPAGSAANGTASAVAHVAAGAGTPTGAPGTTA